LQRRESLQGTPRPKRKNGYHRAKKASWNNKGYEKLHAKKTVMVVAKSKEEGWVDKMSDVQATVGQGGGNNGQPS